MKKITCLPLLSTVFAAVLLSACNNNGDTAIKAGTSGQQGLPIIGTWKLLSGTLVEKGDTTVTDYTKTSSFIKIINNTHFAFLQHDLQHGKDTANASFSSGGGTYTLKDSSYTEHLEYCTAREWEGHDFSFTLTLNNDTLVQRGIEKVEAAGVERLNIEKYVRLK